MKCLLFLLLIGCAPQRENIYAFAEKWTLVEVNIIRREGWPIRKELIYKNERRTTYSVLCDTSAKHIIGESFIDYMR